MFLPLVSCLAAASLIVAFEEPTDAVVYQPLNHPERRLRPAIAWIEQDDDDNLSSGVLSRSSNRELTNPRENQQPTNCEFLLTRSVKEEWQSQLRQLQTSSPPRPEHDQHQPAQPRRILLRRL